MNTLQIIARVAADPEQPRQTPSGKAVLEIRVAVDDGWGENKKTVWLGCTLWGPTAELAARALRKGDRVGLSGRLSQDEWTDKQSGAKRTQIKMICENMTLLGDKREGNPQASQQWQQAPPQNRQPATSVEYDKYDQEAEVPF